MTTKKKIIKKTTTPSALGVKGETAGEFLLSLQKNLPASPLDLKLDDGKSLLIGNNKIELKFPKNKELRLDQIEEILNEGSKCLLEENKGRVPDNRDRVKITLSLGNDTVYFSNGHLSRDDAGNPIPMDPVLSRTDESIVRILEPTFTQDIGSLAYQIRKQHNKTLGKNEEDITDEIATALGFVTVDKADSVMEVDIDGTKDPCIVERLCIHADEFSEIEKVVESVISTYRGIIKLKIAPLIILGLNGAIDITISRDRKTVSIEQKDLMPESILNLVETLLNLLIAKENVDNIAIDYNVEVYEEIPERKLIQIKEDSTIGGILATLRTLSGKIEDFREKHEQQIVWGLALISILVLFAFSTNADQNRNASQRSFFQATITMILPIVLAVAITIATRGHKSWKIVLGQKRFLAYIWIFSVITNSLIISYGFEWYLNRVITAGLGIAGIMIGFGIFYCLFKALAYVAHTLSPPTKRLTGAIVSILKTLLTPIARFIWHLLNTLLFNPIERLLDILDSQITKAINRAKNSKAKEIVSVTLKSKPVKSAGSLLSIGYKIVSTLVGVVIVIFYALAFLPMFALLALFNMGNKKYWKAYGEYRAEMVEKAIHKYMDQKKLKPTCRVIFTPKNCKKMGTRISQLNSMGAVLSKKLPNLLTVDGFVNAVDYWVTDNWM